ncbi:helix-turn-helix domain-containing protein [Methylobacterium frigidaeris]|uniref:OmpR/PhoB-type domain-containing protein n=1 Tax=Methylobacterium frigidaeris TaxID=2038277 RepID=A0AA37HFM3_9HYPH|nr:helix-turn-helix domain-containing protein [Methylobacterium frigidaeris]GJD65146.1 hypothetical protein MPEAHAMD_5333 [Methylobacterium frigidaeris]
MLSLDPITLRERVEELEEEVRQLRAMMSPRLHLPATWNLTPAMRRILSTLMARAPGIVTHDHLLEVCMSDQRRNDPPSIETPKVQICKMRPKLAQLVPGATIETAWGEGYWISLESAALIREAIARDLAGPVAEAA